MVSTDVSATSATPVIGWRSDHLSADGGPVAWSTAQVFFTLSQCKRLVKKLLTEDILEEFRGSPASAIGASAREWEILMDTDLVIDGQVSSLKTGKGVLALSPSDAPNQKSRRYFFTPLFSLPLLHNTGPPDPYTLSFFSLFT